MSKAIKKLNDNYSTARDGVPANFIKNCSNTLLFPLFLLFTRSINESYIPTIWKSSYITHKNC